MKIFKEANTRLEIILKKLGNTKFMLILIGIYILSAAFTKTFFDFFSLPDLIVVTIGKIGFCMGLFLIGVFKFTWEIIQRKPRKYKEGDFI